MTNDLVFNRLVLTKNAISLAHRLINHSIVRNIDGKFCAVSVVGSDGKILCQVGMSGCSDHLLHLTAVQAKEAIKGLEGRWVDRIHGRGGIKGHFGAKALREKKLYVGFYVKNMNADKAADIIEELFNNVN